MARPGKLRGLTRAKLEELYRDREMSQSEIAQVYGVHQTAVQQRMKHLGVEPRARRDGIILTRQAKRFSGPRNPRWNGGRHITAAGYVMVRRPEHHRANRYKGYVREHILVWEEANGRELPAGWDVHHMNGDKQDNRPDNLVAMPSREHKLVIAAYKAHIARLEATIRRLGAPEETTR